MGVPEWGGGIECLSRDSGRCTQVGKCRTIRDGADGKSADGVTEFPSRRTQT